MAAVMAVTFTSAIVSVPQFRNTLFSMLSATEVSLIISMSKPSMKTSELKRYLNPIRDFGVHTNLLVSLQTGSWQPIIIGMDVDELIFRIMRPIKHWIEFGDENEMSFILILLNKRTNRLKLVSELLLRDYLQHCPIDEYERTKYPSYWTLPIWNRSRSETRNVTDLVIPTGSCQDGSCQEKSILSLFIDSEWNFNNNTINFAGPDQLPYTASINFFDDPFLIQPMNHIFYDRFGGVTSEHIPLLRIDYGNCHHPCDQVLVPDHPDRTALFSLSRAKRRRYRSCPSSSL